MTETAYFPQSVASGDPKPDSVILWSRLEDSTAGELLKIRVQIATDLSFTDIQGDQIIAASTNDDGVIKIRVAGLSADTIYYYRFFI